MAVPFVYFQLMINLLLHFSCFHKTVICTSTDSFSLSGSAPPPPPVQYSPCHADERSALLQFKQTISINESASVDPSAYNKVESWKLTDQGESSNCCSWDGVECDEFTGHVIGLDLGSSFLYGSINSSSSLFSLLHLQSLNLANNDFNHSQIPSEIGHLSALTSLNLSNSVFSGQIPPSISKLSKLVSLDLSSDHDIDGPLLLRLEQSSFTRLVRNLTNIEQLHLSHVSINSQVPEILVNLTSLTSLALWDCELYGEFPTGIFHLPKLQLLKVGYDEYLTGHLPEFNQSICLEILSIAFASFSGKLPDSLNNLSKLTVMDLHGSKFSGDIPSLGGLSQLEILSLENEFNVGTLPNWLGKLTELRELLLVGINLYGSIPSSLFNLTHLTYVVLDFNHLTGKIPPQLANLSQLIGIYLSKNQFNGPIPSTISGLKNLECFDVSFNHLSGTVEIGMFLKLKSLVILDLRFNKLTVLTKNITNTTLPQFQILGLSSCNLGRFPDFLHSQHELQVLFLQDNQIHGHIPSWMLNKTQEKLYALSLAHNFVTGFDQSPNIPPWANLGFLSLASNLLEGPLPKPPQSIFYYDVSHNKLRGEIPPLICGLSSLELLDLSNNNLSGTIPPCLSNFSDSLSVLNLKGNKFHGPIPQTYDRGNKLKVIDFSQNQLQGKVPRSLSNCMVLEILDLSDNMFEDMFPFWLGALTKLQVLILRSNKFYGALLEPRTKSEFPNLRIIDLSHNGFTGHLPTKYFKFWNAMKISNLTQESYMYTSVVFQLRNQIWTDIYPYTMSITSKGVKRKYEKIQSIFTAVDLSSNKFEWEIPESVGSLTALQLLNLSNNNLSGGIPLSLGNLTNLESLDLSQNKFSGEIPQQLAQLTFLAVFDVSHNNLKGRIPTGKQFDTFENSSYDENAALCGSPLSRKCENLEAQPKPSVDSERREDSTFPSTTVDWIIISLGYGSGIIVGVVIGQTLTTRYHEWFLETFGRKKEKKQRKKKTMGRQGNRS